MLRYISPRSAFFSGMWGSQALLLMWADGTAARKARIETNDLSSLLDLSTVVSIDVWYNWGYFCITYFFKLSPLVSSVLSDVYFILFFIFLTLALWSSSEVKLGRGSVITQCLWPLSQLSSPLEADPSSSPKCSCLYLRTAVNNSLAQTRVFRVACLRAVLHPCLKAHLVQSGTPFVLSHNDKEAVSSKGSVTIEIMYNLLSVSMGSTSVVSTNCALKILKTIVLLQLGEQTLFLLIISYTMQHSNHLCGLPIVLVFKVIKRWFKVYRAIGLCCMYASITSLCSLEYPLRILSMKCGVVLEPTTCGCQGMTRFLMS